MARLCIRVTPNNHPTDESLNSLRFQPGDVVSLVSDEHRFSDGELRCGHYAVVDIPAVAPEDLTHLVEVGEAGDGSLVLKRAVSVDWKAPLALPALTDDVVSLSMYRDAAAETGRAAAADALAAMPELSEYVDASLAAVGKITTKKPWQP